MKILDEFMAQKYVARHGVSIACTRPAGGVRPRPQARFRAVGGGVRDRSRARTRSRSCPSPAHSRDTWIYKDDCAEQLVRLALKPSLAHFAYNNGGDSVTAEELAAAVRHWLPDAQIEFDESKPTTPLIDWQDGRRIEKEIGFKPRPLVEGVRAHINQAREEAGLEPV